MSANLSGLCNVFNPTARFLFFSSTRPIQDEFLNMIKSPILHGKFFITVS